MSKFSRRRFQISGQKGTAIDMARGRLVLVSAFFVFCCIIVVARAADVSIIQGALSPVGEGKVYSASSDKQAKLSRADIVDRNGVLLARSLKTASLYVDPALVKEPKKLAKDLVSVFPDLSYGDVLQKVQSKKRFVWIKRNITPEDHSKILYLGNPSLDFKEEERRIYPQGSLTAHMVGVSGVDGQGLSGIEKSFDKLLDETDEELKLSLDVRVQHILKREISATMKNFNAKGAAGVVMDVDSGEVLASVSLPDFDPHLYGEAKGNQKFNRVSLGVYELGSSFKLFSTAAFLEHEKTSMGERFDVRQPIKHGRFKIRDYHPEKRVLTLPEVFIHSSNIGSAMMGQRLGSKKIQDFYKDLGLMSAPSFEIGEVGRPIVPDPWRDINTMTASFGHGIAVSPLQLTKAAASIVNGGIVVNPTLVLDSNSSVKRDDKNSIRVVSEKTSHRMKQLLRLAVTQGTGGNADVEGYLVGGKTGTAEKPSAGGYNRNKLISSFLGFFPMNKPKYAVFIMVDEPKGNKASYGYATGGWVGAPTVGKVISSMVSLLGLPAEDGDTDIEHSLVRYVKTKQQIQKERSYADH